ncbi:MAG: integral membrane sensor signal transduction histidine kinase, partial [bacterium]
SNLGIEVIVDDEGPGPAPTLFHRAGVPGHSTRGKGRGFGLFIVRRLVERVGGRLDIGSGIQGGARIQMALPAGGGELACCELES